MEDKDYVSSDVAKLLHEKRFDSPCGSFYTEEGELWHSRFEDNFNRMNFYSRPTLYDAQKWLWNNHMLFVASFVESPFGEPFEFIYCIQCVLNTIDDYGTIVSDKSFESIQEALNLGIFEALKLI